MYQGGKKNLHQTVLLHFLAAKHLVLTWNLILRRGLLGLAAAVAVLHFSNPDLMTDAFLLLQ